MVATLRQPPPRHSEQLLRPYLAVGLGGHAVHHPAGEAVESGMPFVHAFVGLQPEDVVDPGGQVLGGAGLVRIARIARVRAKHVHRDGRFDGDDPAAVEHLPLAEDLAHLGQVDVAGEDHGGVAGTLRLGLRPAERVGPGLREPDPAGGLPREETLRSDPARPIGSCAMVDDHLAQPLEPAAPLTAASDRWWVGRSSGSAPCPPARGSGRPAGRG